MGVKRLFLLALFVIVFSTQSNSEKVNISNLLEQAGCKTFLSLITSTEVLKELNNYEKNAVTVFAPTDEAFKAKNLPNLSELTNNEITTLLKYHAAPGYNNIGMQIGSDILNTLATNDQRKYLLYARIIGYLEGINILTGRSDPKCNSSNIVIEESKLNIYTINQVLLPMGFPAGSTTKANIIDILSLAGCKTFAKLLTTTKVLEEYQMATNKGITIFAPTDKAFKNEDLPDLRKLTTTQVKTLLRYHAVNSYITLDKLAKITKPISTLATNSSEKYKLYVFRSAMKVCLKTGFDAAEIIDIEFEISPIQIYSIDNVLIPMGFFQPSLM